MSETEGKTIFSRRLEQFDGLTWLTPTLHIGPFYDRFTPLRTTTWPRWQGRVYALINRVPTLLLTKKSRTFPGLSRTPWKIFQDLFGASECLNIKEKNGIYLQYSESSPLQKIQHEAKCYLSKQQSTQTGCYTIAACFPFEPLEKCMTFNDMFPGLSRTLSFNFQNFPGPKWFSRTFQVLEFSRKKSRTFQNWTRRRGNPE